MTLGGQLDISEDGFRYLRSLITTVLGLPHDYPENDNFCIPPSTVKVWSEQGDLHDDFSYFFDIASYHRNKPDVKFYLPTRRYRPDDLAIANRLVDWMKKRGRSQYADHYLNMVKALAEHRGPENGKGIHSHISYEFTESGILVIKSYLNPKIYHPARFSKSQ